MAFNAFGFKTISHIGTINGSAGSMRSLHAYVTNDDAAAVAASGYFNEVADRIQTGDQVHCSLDLDGTPRLRTYLLINTAGVITTQLSVATAAV